MAEKKHSLAGVFLRAAYEGKLDVVQQMLKDGIPVDCTHQTGLQALHFAARSGNVDLAAELIKHGAQVNAATMKGNTPLHVAALMARTNMVKLLLQKGAEVNTQSECNSDTFTPLYMAAQIGNQEIVMLLLAHGADPSIPTKNQCTARDVAIQQGYQAVAELLEEWERRLAGGEPSHSDGIEEAPAEGDATPVVPVEQKSPLAEVPASQPMGGCRLKTMLPPVYDDVIPSPRNSPQRSHPSINLKNPAHVKELNGACVSGN